MPKMAINFYNRIRQGEKPTVYCLIHTDMGYRAYAEKELSQIFEVGGIYFDGINKFDASWKFGQGLGLLDKQGRVLSFGNFERTIQPRKRDVLNSYSSKQLQHLTVTLDNQDRYFSRMLPNEPWLTKTIDFYAGFEADPFREHIRVIGGRITQISMGPKMIVEGDER